MSSYTSETILAIPFIDDAETLCYLDALKDDYAGLYDPSSIETDSTGDAFAIRMKQILS
jgi:hypothetical protein